MSLFIIVVAGDIAEVLIFISLLFLLLFGTIYCPKDLRFLSYWGILIRLFWFYILELLLLFWLRIADTLRSKSTILSFWLLLAKIFHNFSILSYFIMMSLVSFQARTVTSEMVLIYFSYLQNEPTSSFFFYSYGFPI